MKRKVGDKVRIKSLEWYDENKNERGNVIVPGVFVPEMAKYCGKEAIITSIDKYYFLDITRDAFGWSDEMFEDDANDVAQVKSEHTPGPWDIESMPTMINNTDEAATIWKKHNPNEGAAMIAVISRSPGDTQAKANATLIKLAPEMIEALKQIEKLAAETNETMRRVTHFKAHPNRIKDIIKICESIIEKI